MDNIQKSIIAVLAIAAFATLIVPSGTSFQPKQPEVAPVADAPDIAPVAPPPSTEPEEASDEYASDDGDLGGPDEYESFGQPMNDARPLGSGPGNGTESPQSNLPAGAFDLPQNSGANYGNAGFAGPTNAPVVTNQPAE